MKNLLLSIIAINLTFISINLTLRSVEPAYAGTDRYEVESIIEDCSVRGDVWIYGDDWGELERGRISC